VLYNAVQTWKGGLELSEHVYDVIVVGAGPAGCSVACDLASRGHDVAVLEQKSQPGSDACCTGIISTECFESLDPGEDVILIKARSATLFSPSGRSVRLRSEKVQAYVVSRPLLDRALAARARSRGAQFLLSALVVDIVPEADRMLVEALRSGIREVFRTRAVVLANGFEPGLLRKLGPRPARGFLIGAQAEVEVTDSPEIEVHFGPGLGNGSFAWLVPVSSDRAYAGLLTASHAALQLHSFLDSLFHGGRIRRPDADIRQKPVPIGTADGSYGDRVLAVGDAAGQVKPTTGGGIYFGHLGAVIAAGVLDEALRDDDLSAARLSEYERRWKARMGRELSRGYRARRAWARLSERQIEGLFRVLDGGGMARGLLRSDGFSFDWHSGLVLALLAQASAYPLRKIKHLLRSEAGP
jgi:digeranylgeranylglycerophospholipid reductase